MLEDSISSSPRKADRSIYKRRLLRKNKRKTKLETSPATSSNALETTLLDNMYYENDSSTSKAPNIENYEPFKEQYLLLAADRMSAQERDKEALRNRMPASQGFQRLDEFVLLNETPNLSTSPKTPTQNPKQTELRFAITDTELFNFCEDAEKQAVDEVDVIDEKVIQDELDATITATPTSKKSKSIVDSILEDFCSSPCSPEKKDQRPLEDCTPTFMFRHKPVRTYVNCKNRNPKVCLSFEKRIESVATSVGTASLPQPAPVLLRDDNDDDDCLSNCSSILSVQENLTEITSDPNADALKDSDRVCGNMMNLSAYFSQLSGNQNKHDESEQEIRVPTDKGNNKSVDEDNQPLNAQRALEALDQMQHSPENLAVSKPASCEAEEANRPSCEQKKINNTTESATEQDMNALYLSQLCDTILMNVDRMLNGENINDAKDEKNCDDNKYRNLYLLNERDTHSINLSPTTFAPIKEGNLFMEADDKDWNEDSEFFLHFKTQNFIAAPEKEIAKIESTKSPTNADLEMNSHMENVTTQDEHQDAAGVLREGNVDIVETEYGSGLKLSAAAQSNEQNLCQDSKANTKENKELCLFELQDEDFSTITTPLLKAANNCDINLNDDNLKPEIALFSEASENFVDDGDFFMNFRTQDAFVNVKIGATTDDATASTSAMMSFQTASRKSITISNEAQKRAAKLLQHIAEAGEIEESAILQQQIEEIATREQLKPFPNATSSINSEYLNPKGTLGKCEDLEKTITEAAQNKLNNVLAEFPELQTQLNKSFKEFSCTDAARREQPPDKLQLSTVQVQRSIPLESIKTHTPEEYQNMQFSEWLLEPSAPIAVATSSSNKLAISEDFGFRTASSKTINISEEAAKRAQSILATVGVEESCLSRLPNINENFDGFRTASEKSIQISEEAARRAQSILATVPTEDCMETNPQIKEGFIGFRTASEKSIKISEEATRRAQSILPTVTTEDHIESGSKIEKSFEGFRTASEKSIQISEEAAKRAQSILATVPTEDCMETSPKIKEGFIGFRTASEKSIKISEEATRRAQSILPTVTTEDHIVSGSKIEKSFEGFRTASEKRIQISEEAARRAQSILATVPTEDCMEAGSKIKKSFEGFRTASEKSIKISEEAARRAQSILATVLTEDCMETSPQIKEGFVGFRTASEKSIKISEEATRRAQSILATVTTEDHIESGSKIKKSFEGFRTASEKSIQISEEAARRAQSILATVPTEDYMETSPKIKENFEGFRTASEKSIKISEEATRRADRILAAVASAAIEDAEVHLADTKDKFEGFRTASRKSVKVSEAAAKRAKSILADLDSSTAVKANELMESDNVQFENQRQASSSSIRVTRAAALKAKSILADLSNVDIIKHFNKQEAHHLQAAVLKTENAQKQLMTTYPCIDNIDRLSPPGDQRNEVGFLTANRKPIEITAAAKQRAASLLAELQVQPEACSNLLPITEKQIQKTKVNSMVPAAKVMEMLPKHEEIDPNFSRENEEFLGFDEDSVEVLEKYKEIELTASQIITNIREVKTENFATKDECEKNVVTSSRRRAKNSETAAIVATRQLITIKRRFSNDEMRISPKCLTRSQTLGSLSQPLTRNEVHSTDSRLNVMAVLAPLNTSVTATLIARKNLLSLNKRQKDQSSTSASVSNIIESSEAATETPIKQRNSTLDSVGSNLMLLTPGTPNLREFFNAVAGTSTPAQPQQQKACTTSCAANIDDDFKQIKWDTPGNSSKAIQATFSEHSLNRSGVNVTLSKSSSKICDTSCDNITITETNPSPKQRIERLRMYGEAPAISPVTMKIVKNCRPSGLRRGRSFKQ